MFSVYKIDSDQGRRMKPIFTVHAGEYLVGSYIEQRLKDKNKKKLNVWIPSKDMGIDLLITNYDNSKTASIQVKFSKDFLTTYGKPEQQRECISWGWWTLNTTKLRKSPADFWIFVLQTLYEKNLQYVIIRPDQLLERLHSLHPKGNLIPTYLWVTANNKCWETRGLSKKQSDMVITGNYNEDDMQLRDFSEFLNNWNPLISKLS